MRNFLIVAIVCIFYSDYVFGQQVGKSPINYDGKYIGLNCTPICGLHQYLAGTNSLFPEVDSKGDVQHFIQCYNNGIEIGNARGYNERKAWILARHSDNPYLMYYSSLHLQPDIGTKTYYRGVAIGYRASSHIPCGTHLAINGKVGIGTLDPSEMLEVKGSIKAAEIKVEAKGNTADFVFEEDYPLKPLSEVEQFVKENKHLPEIPSAKNMEKDGVNLAEMNKLLLQKVEELTLYMIEQNKRIQHIDTKNQQLEKKLKNMQRIIQNKK